MKSAKRKAEILEKETPAKKKKISDAPSTHTSAPPSIDPLSLPRLSSSTPLSRLKEEAKARGVFAGKSGYTKEQFLDLLRVGSIHLTATTQYRALEEVKGIMVKEEEERNPELAMAKKAKEDKLAESKRRQAELKASKENDARKRQEEIDKQVSLHTSRSSLHPCSLADSSLLMIRGKPRVYTAQCDNRHTSLFPCSVPVTLSCEKCDFDLCSNCVNFAKLSEEEQARRIRIREDQMKAEREMERRKREEEEERRHRDFEIKEKEKADAKAKLAAQVYPPHVVKPVNHSMDKPLKYVVFSTDGYLPDGFHRYQGPPEVVFDSSFSSKEDAFLRAQYVFYHQNPWGISLNDFDNFEEEVEDRVTTGMRRLRVVTDDNSEWVVVAGAMEMYQLKMEERKRKDEDSEDEDAYDYEGVF